MKMVDKLIELMGQLLECVVDGNLVGSELGNGLLKSV